jgi:hypothetical protein
LHGGPWLVRRFPAGSAVRVSAGSLTTKEVCAACCAVLCSGHTGRGCRTFI